MISSPTFANCRFGSEVQCPPVNHDVVGSRLDYRDYFFSLFKVPLAAYAAYSVKRDLLHSFSNYSVNTDNFNNFGSAHVLPDE